MAVIGAITKESLTDITQVGKGFEPSISAIQEQCSDQMSKRANWELPAQAFFLHLQKMRP